MLTLLLFTGCADKASDTGAVEAAAPVALDDGAVVFAEVALIPSGEVADVVVLGGVIDGILPAGGAYEGEVTIIDGAGRFLAPGLSDLHVHLWEEGDLWLYLANGVTTIRNLFGDPAHLDWRAAIAAGDLAGPTLITTGPIIDGPDPYWRGSASVSDADEARAVAAEQIAAGYDALKIYDGVPADAWEALIQAAAEAGLPAVGHVPDAVGYRAVAQGGQRTVEHLDDVVAAAAEMDPFSPFDLSAGQAALAAMTDDAVARIAADSAAAGVWNIPTLTVVESYGRAPDWDFEDPRLDYLSPQTRNSWSQTHGYITAEQAAHYADFADAMCEVVAALHEAGAPMALGTDVINPFVYPGWSVHEELASLVACGLSPAEALALSTAAAAEALGEPGSFGVIAEGARADLLLLAADPRDDVAALGAPEIVMASGRWWTAEALASELDALEATYAGR